MAPVPYTEGNLERCRCIVCPVHSSSRCAVEHTAQAERQSLPDPKLIEMEYCSQSVDRSTCGDLDGSLQCLCATCPVWQEHGLRAYHFCINGAAK